MIKLKDILLEAKSPSIFIPRRLEDRVDRYVKIYIRNGCKGDLELDEMNLTEFPKILKNVTVRGDFVCNNSNITSLKNSPKIIRGNFYCTNNKLLTSLEGGPTFVRDNFICIGNYSLRLMKGMPKKIGGNVYCYDNGNRFYESDIGKISNVKGYIETTSRRGM